MKRMRVARLKLVEGREDRRERRAGNRRARWASRKDTRMRLRGGRVWDLRLGGLLVSRGGGSSARGGLVYFGASKAGKQNDRAHRQQQCSSLRQPATILPSTVLRYTTHNGLLLSGPSFPVCSPADWVVLRLRACRRRVSSLPSHRRLRPGGQPSTTLIRRTVVYTERQTDVQCTALTTVAADLTVVLDRRWSYLTIGLIHVVLHISQPLHCNQRQWLRDARDSNTM